jgi:hypothetical protein
MALTPSAQSLLDRLNRILAEGKNRPKGTTYLCRDLQDALKAMTPKDMLELDPPSIEAGIWTNDAGFCKRLGARLFGVSPESVDELPWTHLIFFQQIVTANFIRCLEEAVP